MTRVVVGSDGSASALGAARAAASLLGAEHQYVVVAVVRPVWADAVTPVSLGAAVPGYWPEPGGLLLDAEELENEALGMARSEAAAAARLLPGHVILRAEIGKPGEVLCAVADEEHAGLVVVGSHGRGAASGLLLGSVSRYLLRHCHRPVLIVPPG